LSLVFSLSSANGTTASTRRATMSGSRAGISSSTFRPMGQQSKLSRQLSPPLDGRAEYGTAYSASTTTPTG
jgi:hypothetical protein